ncbi:MAG: hypothetical protein ABI462_08540 [Ignavibacteria bacterium]
MSIKIFYGQKAVSRIFIDKDLISIPGSVPQDFDFQDDVIGLRIGENKILNGKALAIFSTVQDISPSDKAAVQIILEGGVKKVVYPPVIQPVSNGGLAYFPFVINFY